MGIAWRRMANRRILGAMMVAAGSCFSQTVTYYQDILLRAIIQGKVISRIEIIIIIATWKIVFTKMKWKIRCSPIIAVF